MRSRRLVEVVVTAAGRGPIGYRELATVVRELVLTRQLLPGDALPSERTLSAALGCSRTTVTAALAVLRSEGVLVSRQGSGTVVAATPDEAVAVESGEVDASGRPLVPDWNRVLDLVTIAPPAPDLLPDLAHAAADRLARMDAGHGLLEAGLPELRRAIAAHLSRGSVPTGPEQVMVTQGVVHGWNLLLAVFGGPGRRVGVEHLGLPYLHSATAASGSRSVPVEVDRDGWRWPRTPLDLVLVTADHHTPTGVDQDDDARRALARGLPRSTRLVVDTALTGLDLDERPARRPIATLRPDTVVLGSLAKTAWSGLRIGWIRASSSTIAAVTAARAASDIGSPVFDQLLAVEVLAHHERIAAQARSRSRARSRHLRAELQHAGWASVVPDGGHCVWLDLGPDASSTALARAARTLDLWLTPGPAFSLTGGHDRFLRLSLQPSEAVLTEAVGRLARVADELGMTAGRVRHASRERARFADTHQVA